jgi:twitching motility protein PilT
MDRIINVFPTDRQEGVRLVLSNVIQSVLSQQLLRRKKGGRCAAIEVMFGSPSLSSLIREGKTHQIAGYIGQGRARGMVGMDDSLRRLLAEDLIEAPAALEKALDKDEMRKWLKERGAELPEDAD